MLLIAIMALLNLIFSCNWPLPPLAQIPYRAVRRLPLPSPAPRHQQPDALVDSDQMNHALSIALKDLPLRQQQAVLLRDWEGLDVRATAQAMGCSAGSVKTHYSRAMTALRQTFGEENG